MASGKKTISFFIEGSPKLIRWGKRAKECRVEYDPRGNALPKLRMTGGQSWKPEVKRYMAWKKQVQLGFLQAIGAPEAIVLEGKPIGKSCMPARMKVVAFYANKKHPDTENVFGSIADALFENDNTLIGSFDFGIANPGDRVGVLVEIHFINAYPYVFA